MKMNLYEPLKDLYKDEVRKIASKLNLPKEITTRVRIIESKDATTANFSKIPYSILETISTRITNEIKGVNRVVYDITNKPPATMEWE